MVVDLAPSSERVDRKPTSSPLGGVGFLVLILWLGLVAGFAELGAQALHDALDGRVTIESIRTNRHANWMIPVSDLAIVGTVGFLGFAVVRRWPSTTRYVTYLLFALACLAPLLVVLGLHPIAGVILAVGLGVRLGEHLRRHPRAWGTMLRFATPVLSLGLLAWIGIESRDVITSERRALESLPAASPNAPNVLLLVMDTVRADHLSLHGYARETTPNLKRWAQRGIRFTQARSTSPWTLPSHASMLTGHWPHRLSTASDRPLDDRPATLAEFLADRGYATGGFVANTYYCNASYGLDRGFARYEDFPENHAVTAWETLRSSGLGRRLSRAAGWEKATPGGPKTRKSADRINDDAIAWLDRNPDRPFFAFLNYYDAHEPYDPPPSYRRRFGLSARDAAYRATIMKRFRNLPTLVKNGAADSAQIAEWSREASELLIDSYDDCITYLDEQIGNLLDELDRRGRLENTLVIVTSDHGEHFGDHGLFGHGHSLYRPLLHVPLVILPPSGSGPKGEVVEDAVCLRDLPATVLDYLGSKEKSPFPGVSLARTLHADPQPTSPPFAAVEHQRKFEPSPNIPASRGALWSLFDGRQVYIRSSEGHEELYDLTRDPFETRNLSQTSEARTILEAFRDSLDAILADGVPITPQFYEND